MSLPYDELDRREMTGAVLKGVAVRTVWLALALVVDYVVCGPSRLVPVVSDSLSFLFVPVIAAVIMRYLAALVPVLFTGRLTYPLNGLLNVIGTTLFFTVAVLAPGFPGGVHDTAPPMLLAGGAWALYVFGRGRSDAARIGLRTVLIVFAGVLALALLAAPGWQSLTDLGWMALAGFLVAAAAGLVGLVANHSNTYLAYVGKRFRGLGWPTFLGLFCFLLPAYSTFVRPGMIRLAGGTAVIVVEWIILLSVLAFAAWMIRSYAKDLSEERRFGDLQTLVQRLSYDRKRLEEATAAVSKFVDGDSKEPLVVYVATVMMDNEAPAYAIEQAIAPIVRYFDDPVPPLIFRWTVGDVDRRNRERRLQAVVAAVAQASGALGMAPPAYAGVSTDRQPPAAESGDMVIS